MSETPQNPNISQPFPDPLHLGTLIRIRGREWPHPHAIRHQLRAAVVDGTVPLNGQHGTGTASQTWGATASWSAGTSLHFQLCGFTLQKIP